MDSGFGEPRTYGTQGGMSSDLGISAETGAPGNPAAALHSLFMGWSLESCENFTLLHGLRLVRVEDIWIPFRKRKRGQDQGDREAG